MADDPKHYTTLALLKDSLDITDDRRDVILLSKLGSAARSVDRHCGRRFWLDADPVARTYSLARRLIRDQDGGERLLVDDIGVDGAAVTVEAGVAGAAGSFAPVVDWELGPENALVDGEPYRWVRRYQLPWRVYYQNRLSRIRITARWGFPSVPEVVAEATLLQATRLYKRRNSPEGVAGSADWGAVRVTRVDPDVEALLADFVIRGIG